MTFYSREIQKINSELYPEDYLSKKVIRARQFIGNHFSENIKPDDLAKEAFISKFYLIRLFKLHCGSTPNQYLISVRIKNAKLLLNDGKTISEVCISVGLIVSLLFQYFLKRLLVLHPPLIKTKPKRKAIFKKHNYKSIMIFAY